MSSVIGATARRDDPPREQCRERAGRERDQEQGDPQADERVVGSLERAGDLHGPTARRPGGDHPHVLAPDLGVGERLARAGGGHRGGLGVHGDRALEARRRAGRGLAARVEALDEDRPGLAERGRAAGGLEHVARDPGRGGGGAEAVGERPRRGGLRA